MAKKPPTGVIISATIGAALVAAYSFSQASDRRESDALGRRLVALARERGIPMAAVIAPPENSSQPNLGVTLKTLAQNDFFYAEMGNLEAKRAAVKALESGNFQVRYDAYGVPYIAHGAASSPIEEPARGPRVRVAPDVSQERQSDAPAQAGRFRGGSMRANPGGVGTWLRGGASRR